MAILGIGDYLRDRLQAVSETCSIEWRGESYDTDAGREDKLTMARELRRMADELEREGDVLGILGSDDE